MRQRDSVHQDRVLYIRVPEEMHRKVRVRAAEEDCTMSEVCELAIRLFLDREPRGKEQGL